MYRGLAHFIVGVYGLDSKCSLLQFRRFLICSQFPRIWTCIFVLHVHSPFVPCWFSIGPWCAVSVCDAISSTTKWPLKIDIHPSIHCQQSTHVWLVMVGCANSFAAPVSLLCKSSQLQTLKFLRQTVKRLQILKLHQIGFWHIRWELGGLPCSIFFTKPSKLVVFRTGMIMMPSLDSVCVSVNHHTDPGPKLLDASNCNTGGSWYHAYIAARARWKRTKAVKGAKMKLELSVYTDWDYFFEISIRPSTLWGPKHENTWSPGFVV